MIFPWQQNPWHLDIEMIMVALRLLGFSGDFSVATNPWHLDIEMIMVALRLHGLEAGTEPERSGFDDFNVFSRCSMVFLPAASLPLQFRVPFFVFFKECFDSSRCFLSF